MIFIWLIIAISGIYFLAKYEDKIGRNSNLFHFLFLINLLLIGTTIWIILGLDLGSGGSPYGDSNLYFNE